jgi:hypothetical protein
MIVSTTRQSTNSGSVMVVPTGYVGASHSMISPARARSAAGLTKSARLAITGGTTGALSVGCRGHLDARVASRCRIGLGPISERTFWSANILSALATQFPQTCSDRHEITGGAGSRHTFPPFFFVVTGGQFYSRSCDDRRGKSHSPGSVESSSSRQAASSIRTSGFARMAER